MSASELAVVSARGRVVRPLLNLYAALCYVFLFGPIVLLVVFSFNRNRYGSFPITGWTTTWYSQVFSDPQIAAALRTSLQVAVEVTIISVVVGTAAAFPLARARLPFRRAFRVSFTIPIMIPGLLIGISLLVFLTDTLHLSLSPETAAIGQAVFTTPFVLLIVAARLDNLDRSIEKAAMDLGANSYNRIRHIVLPLLAPAVMAGALIAFTLSLDEFIITSFLIGDNNTLPIYIYTQVRYGITPEINALASLLLATSIVLILLAGGLPAAVGAARRRRGRRRVA